MAGLGKTFEDLDLLIHLTIVGRLDPEVRELLEVEEGQL